MILGLAIAWVIVRSTIWGRNVVDALMMLPLAVPGLVLAFGYRALSDGNFSWLVGASGDPMFLLILAYAVRRLPFVVRAAVAGLQQSDPVLEEAAMTMGASPKADIYAHWFAFDWLQSCSGCYIGVCVCDVGGV